MLSGYQEDYIRRLSIGSGDCIRAILPSKSQLKTLNALPVMGVHSFELAEILSISLQNASSKLTKLYSMGYLSRVNTGDPSGGTLYTYKLKELR